MLEHSSCPLHELLATAKHRAPSHLQDGHSLRVLVQMHLSRMLGGCDDISPLSWTLHSAGLTLPASALDTPRLLWDVSCLPAGPGPGGV